MTVVRVLPDSVSTKDLLNFERYLAPLIEVIAGPNATTPFTIGVFGAWGSGKSTLLSLLDARLAGLGNKFVRVHFNPWLHRKEPNLLIPLLHTLQDTLEADKGARFAASVKKIANVLLRLGADVLLKTLTASEASLEKIEKLEEQYLAAKGAVQSEMRTLRKNLETMAEDVRKAGAAIVFFIDDLDRCEPSDIVDLLEAIKLFLDVPNVFVVLAVDKEVVDRGIAIKYAKFFPTDPRRRAEGIGAEYLEKMVQLPLSLLPLDRSQVGGLLAAMGEPGTDPELVGLLSTIVLANPRKMKRVMNLLAVNRAIADLANKPTELDWAIATRLAVLQVQSPVLHADVARVPQLLQALEDVYAGSLNLSDKTKFEARFPGRGGTLQELCTQHYDQGSYLNELFSGSPFAKVHDRISTYLSLFGG